MYYHGIHDAAQQLYQQAIIVGNVDAYCFFGSISYHGEGNGVERD